MLGFGGNIRASGEPIGVAVGARDVRLAQRASGGYRFEREPLAADVEITGPAFHAECQRAIATALRRGKFSGKKAVSALPPELLRYKTLRLPPMPAEDMEQAVAWEAAERFQLTEDQALQHYTAGQVNQGNEQREEIILLAAEKNAVYDHAVALRKAGLQPVAIDATGAALGRILGSAGQSALVIHLGPTVAEVVGLRGHDVIFDKPIDLQDADGSLDLTHLSREVSLCVRYLSVTFGIHKPDASWLAGEGASEALAKSLTAGLNLPVQLASDAPALQSIDCDGPNAAQWVVALGLSIREQTAKRGAA